MLLLTNFRKYLAHGTRCPILTDKMHWSTNRSPWQERLHAELRKFCEVFRGFFPIFFIATVGGSIEYMAFDKIARSIELHVRFDFRRREKKFSNVFYASRQLHSQNTNTEPTVQVKTSTALVWSDLAVHNLQALASAGKIARESYRR